MMSNAFAEAWRGMGVFKWPIIGLIVLGFFVAPSLGPPSPSWFDNGEQVFAGGTVRLKTSGALEENGTLDFRVHASGVAPGQATIQLSGGEEAAIRFEPEAEETVIEVSLKAPAKLDRLQVILSMTPESGSAHQVTWDLGPGLGF